VALKEQQSLLKRESFIGLGKTDPTRYFNETMIQNFG